MRDPTILDGWSVGSNSIRVAEAVSLNRKSASRKFNPRPVGEGGSAPILNRVGTNVRFWENHGELALRSVSLSPLQL